MMFFGIPSLQQIIICFIRTKTFIEINRSRITKPVLEKIDNFDRILMSLLDHYRDKKNQKNYYYCRYCPPDIFGYTCVNCNIYMPNIVSF